MHAIRQAVGQVFVGQDEVVHQVLAALLAGGHVLLEGKPGLGKTHLVLALARTFSGNFRRIQFTPDLMPSDVTGHTLFDLSSQTFRVRRGPIFTNLLLADEINRAPAKTQSSLLEVMQEAQVTIDGESHPVALTGKVYVKAVGPIKVGDLLTTSSVPGHAMAATDRDRAFGATLGKAMSNLDEGTGLVLVLVSLQ